MNIGGTLKQIRKAQKLNQQHVAELAGMTQTYLSLIEGNVREPSFEALSNIALALGTTLAIVFVMSVTPEDIVRNDREDVNVLKLFKVGKEILLMAL